MYQSGIGKCPINKMFLSWYDDEIYLNHAKSQSHLSFFTFRNFGCVCPPKFQSEEMTPEEKTSNNNALVGFRKLTFFHNIITYNGYAEGKI